MGRGRIYAPPAVRARALLLCLATILAIVLLGWPRPRTGVSRSGRLLIENAGAGGGAAHATAVGAAALPAGAAAGAAATGDQPIPAAVTAGSGVATATTAGAAPAPAPAPAAATTADAAAVRAPVRPVAGQGQQQQQQQQQQQAPTRPASDEGVRPTSRLSAAAQALLAEAAKTVSLPDDQVAWRGHKSVVSWHPRAFTLHGFLSPAECAYLIEKSKPYMEVSTVVDNETGKSVPSTVRTSDGLFLDKGEDAVVLAIERRIALATDLPIENGEGMQILHYENGAKYEPHHDFFHDTVNSRPENGGQRIATVLMYLSTPEEGGETVFPRASTKVSGPGWSDCAREGLAVKPVAGDALLFYGLLPDGSLDHNSLHGSCPTTKGSKWSATKWIHTGRFGGDAMGALARWNACADLDPACPAWAARGECAANPGFMLASCRRSCVEECKDVKREGAGGVLARPGGGGGGGGGGAAGGGQQQQEDKEELVDLNGDLGLKPGDAARSLLYRIRDAQAAADAKRRQEANAAAAANGGQVVL